MSRLVALVGLSLSSSCGHIGIDLEPSGSTDLDGSSDRSDGSGGKGGGSDTGGSDTGGSDAGGSDAGGSDAGGSDAGGSDSGGSDSGGSDSGGSDSGGSDSGGSDSGGSDSGGSDSGGSDSGGGVIEGCEGSSTEVNFALMGWATEDGGTTGGKGGTTVTVETGAALLSALENKSENTPLTILVNGTITPQNSGAEKIDIRNVRDLSIIGVGSRGEFDGIGLKVKASGNIVLRNLRIHHVSQGEGDAIGIEGPSDHIWVDHCDLYADFQGVDKGVYDGLLDAKGEVEYLTYSWNYIHDSWEVGLVGATENDTFDRKLTMHHNWISNCNSGGPVFRGGNGHVFNNLYEDVETMAINSRLDACVLVQNNRFVKVTNPWVSAYSEELGGIHLVCNELDQASTFSHSQSVSEAPSCDPLVPYDYADSLTLVESVSSLVKANAGVDKLSDPEAF